MSEEQQGPLMWVATSVMKPPPTLIGKVGPSFTLPRPVTLLVAVAAVIGAFLGLALALVVGGANLQSVVMGVVLGGALGAVAVTVQPMENESLGKWLGLQFQNVAAKRVTLGGKPVRLYLGIAPLKRVAEGPLMLVPAGVEVQPDQYDERGVAIPLGSAAPVELTPAPLLELQESKTPSVPIASDVPFELPRGGGRGLTAPPRPSHLAPAGGRDISLGAGGFAPPAGAPVLPDDQGWGGGFGPPAGAPVLPAGYEGSGSSGGVPDQEAAPAPRTRGGRRRKKDELQAGEPLI